MQLISITITIFFRAIVCFLCTIALFSPHVIGALFPWTKDIPGTIHDLDRRALTEKHSTIAEIVHTEQRIRRRSLAPLNTARIVGGNVVQPGVYPYYVWLDGCGGSLIAPTVVLTAAHCQPSSYVNSEVTVGASGLSSLDNGNFKDAERINVKNAASHPQYDGFDLNNDFALLLLSKPYVIDSNIKLLLNDQSTVPSNGELLNVIGLGNTSEGGNLSNKLREVRVPEISNSQCNNYYTGEISDKMLCAGFPEGSKDSCQGDSGGPLLKTVGSTHYQVGVVSWGEGCARPNKPGVYARVSEGIDWIKEVVCNQWNVQGSDLCGSSPNPVPPTPPTPPTPPSDNDSPSNDEVDNGSCDDGRSELKLSFVFDDYSEDISWEVYSGQQEIASNLGYDQFLTQISETIPICNNKCYSVTIYDDYGDSLCCDAGQGGYSMQINDGDVFRSGDSFGFSITENFCLNEKGDITEDNDNDFIEPVPLPPPSLSPLPPPSPPPMLPPTLPPIPPPSLSPLSLPSPPPVLPPTPPPMQSMVPPQEEDDSGCNKGSSDFVLNFEFDLYSDDISWRVNSGSAVIAKNPGYGPNKTDASEFLTLCNGNCYKVTIKDKFKNGLCCDDGNGEYSIEINGSKTFEGSSFGKKAVHEFCLTDNGELATESNNEECRDDPNFRHKNKKNRTCEWVGKKRKKRCKKKFKGKRVHTYCQETCGKC